MHRQGWFIGTDHGQEVAAGNRDDRFPDHERRPLNVIAVDGHCHELVWGSHQRSRN
jgi:hypothetical protein